MMKCCLLGCWDRGRSVDLSRGCSTAPCTGTCTLEWSLDHILCAPFSTTLLSTSNYQDVQHHHPRLHSRASMCDGVKVFRHRLALGWQQWDGGGVGHQDQVKFLQMKALFRSLVQSLWALKQKAKLLDQPTNLTSSSESSPISFQASNHL